MERDGNAMKQWARHEDGMARIPLLVARRYLLPVVLTVAILDLGFLLFVPRASPLLEDPAPVALAALLLPLFPVGFGMLVIGFPAGYLVARLRLGLVESLALLVAIGFGLPAALALPIVGLASDTLIFALPGALAAAVWTLVNHDLFRRHNGA